MKLSHAEQNKSSLPDPKFGDATPLYHTFIQTLDGAPKELLTPGLFRFLSGDFFFGDLLDGWWWHCPEPLPIGLMSKHHQLFVLENAKVKRKETITVRR